MTPQVILGFIRHLITYGAGILVTRGVISESSVEIIASSLLGILGVAWSAYNKKNAAVVLEEVKAESTGKTEFIERMTGQPIEKLPIPGIKTP